MSGKSLLLSLLLLVLLTTCLIISTGCDLKEKIDEVTLPQDVPATTNLPVPEIDDAMVVGISGNGEESQVEGDTFALTSDDVRSKYDPEELKNVWEIGLKTVLVESQDELSPNIFTLYDLKTGRRDVLPTGPAFVELKEIVNHNYFIFTCSGKLNETLFQTFPEVVECIRYRDNGDPYGNFKDFRREIYYQLNETVEVDSGKEGALANVLVTLEGVQFLFKPIPGTEAGFYAATTDIPPTHIQYRRNSDQMVVVFSGATLGSHFEDGYVIVRGENPFFNAIMLTQDGRDVIITITLRDVTRQYSVQKNHLPLPQGLPYLNLLFGKGDL